MQEKIEAVRGLTMPFYLAHPTRGRPLRTPRLVEELHKEISEPGLWVVQPLLAGERACLAVVDKKIYVQDDHGKWYQKPLRRTYDFVRLPNRTIFDGVIYEGQFHPFDLLGIGGKSFLYRSADEREALAFQMVRLMRHRWMFPKPSKAWLLRGAKNLPMYAGVVLKDNRHPVHYYLLATRAGQTTRAWFERKWS